MYVSVAILLSPHVASVDRSEASLRRCTVDYWLHPCIIVRFLLLAYFRLCLSCSAADPPHFSSSIILGQRVVVSFRKPWVRTCDHRVSCCPHSLCLYPLFLFPAVRPLRWFEQSSSVPSMLSTVYLSTLYYMHSDPSCVLWSALLCSILLSASSSPYLFCFFPPCSLCSIC